MAASFWHFALALWQHKPVEELALTVQREHGPVALFLLGLWLGRMGQEVDANLGERLRRMVAPVEAQLIALRQQRAGLTGAAKKAVLQQELALEQQLYQQLGAQVTATGPASCPLVQAWWAFFFPQVGPGVRAAWWATCADKVVREFGLLPSL